MKYRGRKPSYNRERLEIVRAMLGQHQRVAAIANVTALKVAY
jgi:hypothetical protein